jgi:hypothetical protein
MQSARRNFERSEAHRQVRARVCGVIVIASVTVPHQERRIGLDVQVSPRVCAALRYAGGARGVIDALVRKFVVRFHVVATADGVSGTALSQVSNVVLGELGLTRATPPPVSAVLAIAAARCVNDDSRRTDCRNEVLTTQRYRRSW